MKNSWILSGNKSISDLINNQELKKLIKIVYLTSTQKFLIDLCNKKKIPYQIKHKEWFKQKKIKNKYKYVWAELDSKKPLELDEMIEKYEKKERSFFILLDHIQDAYNFGAILRTCAAAGVDGVIISNKKQAPLNYCVLKASQGIALNVDLSIVENLNQALNKLKKFGYWIYSSSLREDSKDYSQIEYEKKSVLILGNEGEGVSNLLDKNSDFRIYIPMEKKVNSLNVSVAAGILIFKILEKSIQKKGLF